MKNLIKKTAISMSFLLLSATVGAKQIGRITFIKGKVEIKDGGGSWKKASLGMPVSDKTAINTGFKSKTVVSLSTGSRLKIKPSTMIKFSNFAKGSFGTATDVDLRLGGVSAIVSKIKKGGERNHFRIRTPTAVAGVRGTEEDIETSPDTGTDITLTESSADFVGKDGTKTRVNQGDSARVERRGSMLPPDQMADRHSRVMFFDPTMSSDEMNAVVDFFDPRFGGSPQDLEFLNDVIENEFRELGHGGAEAVDFEKL